MSDSANPLVTTKGEDPSPDTTDVQAIARAGAAAAAATGQNVAQNADTAAQEEHQIDPEDFALLVRLRDAGLSS